jgi:16S rRNA (guanine527-N7)-methyltransferase
LIEATLRETFKHDLYAASKYYGLSLTEQQNESLLRYLELLIKWNKAYNLTAIRKPEEMFIKHLLDSISIAPFIKAKRILDVGTGPGLPGIPLAILFPAKDFVLLDSNGKKTRFLVQAQMSLEIKNIQVLNDRVESVSGQLKFDQIVSRAFTALDNMVELCKHLLSSDGEFLAMKGLIPEKEIALLDADYTIAEIKPLSVPGCEEQRHLVIVRKC